MSSRKTTYFPLPQRIISKYDFCRRHHTMEQLWEIFPRNGTTLAQLFHTVENSVSAPQKNVTRAGWTRVRTKKVVHPEGLEPTRF